MTGTLAIPSVGQLTCYPLVFGISGLSTIGQAAPEDPLIAVGVVVSISAHTWGSSEGEQLPTSHGSVAVILLAAQQLIPSLNDHHQLTHQEMLLLCNDFASKERLSSGVFEMGKSIIPALQMSAIAGALKRFSFDSAHLLTLTIQHYRDLSLH